MGGRKRERDLKDINVMSCISASFAGINIIGWFKKRTKKVQCEMHKEPISATKFATKCRVASRNLLLHGQEKNREKKKRKEPRKESIVHASVDTL